MERPVSLRYLPFADPWALMCCWAGKGYKRPKQDVARMKRSEIRENLIFKQVSYGKTGGSRICLDDSINRNAIF